ncbi:MAG: hypothetical protein CO142_02450, partial [Candidatus Moranbacteria bacterium CG_4_9_14_3_um_filter_44_28]
VCQANKFTKTIMFAKLVIKICVFFINFTNRQFWAACQFHWHEIRRRRKARAGKNSFPPPPSFLPARAEKFFFLPSEARQSKFAIWILLKKSSDFVQ